MPEFLTHIPTIKAVQAEVERLVRQVYGGWRESDQEDLVSLVLEKYIAKFGREEADVPTAWLRAVVRTTGIDFHDKQQRRPAEPVDFGADDEGWDAVAGLIDLRTPSLMTARGLAAQEALNALGEQSPGDRDLVELRVVWEVSLAEIAERIGKSQEATKKAVQRAVARLRQIIASDPALHDALADRAEYPLDD